MLSSFFYKLVGKHDPSPNDFNHHVEILAWYHPTCVPAQHLALRVHIGGDIYYLSFVPKILDGLSDRSFFKLRTGVEAVFVDTYEKELLVQGFRKAWPNIDDITETQRAFILTRKIKKISYLEILEIAEDLSPAIKASLYRQGQPDEIIALRTLDLNTMVKMINHYKNLSPPMAWAAWAGTYLHQENTHNCSSIVLDVLYHGGFGHLIHSYRHLTTIAGTLLGVSYALYHQNYAEKIMDFVIEILQCASIGFISGRGIGGAIEGYKDIQSFLNLIDNQGNNSINAMVGLRLTNVILSTLIGLIKQGPVLPSLLTLPRDVLNLAHEAKNEEESLYSFSVNEIVNSYQNRVS